MVKLDRKCRIRFSVAAYFTFGLTFSWSAIYLLIPFDQFAIFETTVDRWPPSTVIGSIFFMSLMFGILISRNMSEVTEDWKVEEKRKLAQRGWVYRSFKKCGHIPEFIIIFFGGYMLPSQPVLGGGILLVAVSSMLGFIYIDSRSGD